MKPGLIVAAQPTIDRTVVINHFEAGKTYRVESVNRLASGKAINVARSLNRMDCPVHVVALLGGYSGQWIADQLANKGIDISPIWVAGENRTAYSIYDPSANFLTEVIEEDDGPVTQENWQELEDTVRNALPASSFLVVSGKASSGSPASGYRRLVELANLSDVPVYLDCYGEYLENAILGRPTVVKINGTEAENFLKYELRTIDDYVEAANRFLSHGIKVAVITLGEKGAIAVDDESAWLAVPPKIKGAAVGSGDVFMAALVYSHHCKRSLDISLQYSVAASAANVLIPGAGTFEVNDIENLLNEVIVQPLPRIYHL